MRRGLFAFTSLVLLAAAWVACVGDDPVTTSPGGSQDGGKQAGERGGPCYPNGTCNDPFKCRDIGEGEKLCLTENEPIPPRDGGADAFVDADPVDTGVDAAPQFCPTSAPIEAGAVGPLCPEGPLRECGAGTYCCMESPYACVTPGSCTNGAWECDSDEQCNVDAGESCCAALARVGDWCPGVGRYVVAARARCVVTPSCGGTGTPNRVCRAGDFCGNYFCRPIVLERNGKQFTYGMCNLDGGPT